MKKKNSLQWDEKKRKWRKGEEEGGRGRKGPISNAFKIGNGFKGLNMRFKAKINYVNLKKRRTLI